MFRKLNKTRTLAASHPPGRLVFLANRFLGFKDTFPTQSDTQANPTGQTP